MMTFAALKRAITPGARIKCLSHWRDAVRKDQPPEAGRVRLVTKTQGNGYWFDRDGKRCWADYPAKAADITFGDGDTFTIQFGDRGTATFQLLAPDAAAA